MPVIGYHVSMFEMKPSLTASVTGDTISYTLVWSPLKKADKYEINASVPSVSGLFELYRMDEQKKLNLLTVTHAWYGGLRSQLRAAVDPDATTDPLRRSQIENQELWFRYCPSDSFASILDAVWFLHCAYFPKDVRVEHSGRYKTIRMAEKAPDKVHWLD